MIHAASFIRDAEIEATLRKIATPVLRAANLNPKNIRIIIINSPEMNAFVAGRDTIFINSGMLTRLKSVEMIQAVIAHEIGHIVAGHLLTRGQSSNSAIGIGILLAAIAARSGNGEMITPLAMGGAQIAKRNALSHSRAKESAADQASVRFLARAGIDPRATLETLNLFRGQEIMATSRIDPYAQTHPLSSQRIAMLRNVANGTRVSKVKREPNLDYWFNRMRAKFAGFNGNPRTTLKRLRRNDSSEITNFKRAIAAHRMSDPQGQKYIAALIKQRPRDPYYRELQAQFLYETGKIDASISAFRHAAKLAPKEVLITAGLARALLAKNQKSATQEALRILKKSRTKDSANPNVLRDLAVAYARLGQRASASLVTAERFALSGRLKDAAIHAKRATGLSKQGTPTWRRANDILTAARRVKP